MAQNALLVFNPASGRRGAKSEETPRLLERLRRLGIEAEPRPTESPGHATELAREAVAQGAELVLVWGGDGTLNEVVAGVRGSMTSVALLPGGSVNVFARVTGIPRRLNAACDLLARAKPRILPVGVANGRPFMLMAGIGLDAEVLHRLSLQTKRSIGVAAFWLRGFSLLAGYHFPPLVVRVEGREYTATGLVAGKSRLYGGRYVVTPAARVEEHLLHAVLFQGCRGRDYLRYLIGVLGGFHLRFRDVVHLKTSRLEVVSTRTVRYQVDGELAGETPVSLTVEPAAVRVLLPNRVEGRATETS